MKLNLTNIIKYLEIPILILFIPFLLCIIFIIVPNGSIGPIVLIFGVSYFFIAPILVYRLIMFLLANDKLPAIANLIRKLIVKENEKVGVFILTFSLIFVSIILGLIVAVIGLNIFIGLTYYFGLKNYDLM
jgi:hypothetical protein